MLFIRQLVHGDQNQPQVTDLGQEAVERGLVATISGATVSSEAVVEIISNAVTQIKEQLQKKGIIGHVEQ